MGLFKHRGKTYLRLIENTSAFGFKRKYVLLKTLRQGKVFWLQYTGDAVCPIWKCCKEQKRENCGGCPDLPCGRFMKDPSISDEENEANLKKMIANLAMYKK